jgi:hypothetical protein
MPLDRKRILPLWVKTVIGVLVVGAPIGVMMAMLIVHTGRPVDFTRWEMYGTRYLRPAARLLGAAVRYRGAQSAVAAAALEGQLDTELRALIELDGELAEPLDTTPAELGARGREDSQPVRIEARWRRLRQQGHSLSEAAALNAAIRTLINHVGDSSKLILDPDLDTYYVMDALLLREPEIVTAIGAIAEEATQRLAAKNLSLEERHQLGGKLAVLQAASEALATDLETAFQETPRFNDHKGLKPALQPRLRAATGALERLVTLVRQGVVVTAVPTATAAEIEQNATAAHEATMQLWADLFDQQDIMLGTRLHGAQTGRRNLYLSALAVVAVLSWLLVQLLRNFKVLRRTISALKDSTSVLQRAVEQIDQHNNAHGQALTRQAAALQETQTTAQQIKQTSQVAARSAVGILEVVERADSLGRVGESAIEASLHGLQDIRDQFSELAVKIHDLNEQTAQIGGITQTVKDLADQSNILALNAAIEAARSGEHGKGFSVVAREIRQLANQSIQATTRVQELLGSIGGAIRQTVSFAETGGQRIEVEVGQVKQSGESLRQLSKIVQESSSGVRQIANAVSEQNAGISQIFTAVIDQNRMMDDTVKRLDDTREATAQVKTASRGLTEVAEQLRV